MPYRKFLDKDKVLAKLKHDIEPFQLESKKHLHLVLCSSIISQQLSTKVATIINQRFLDLIGKKNPTAKDIAGLPYDALRSIGLSHAKATYVHNVAAYWVDQKLTDKKLHAMTDDQVKATLIQIKGIGEWTAEMLLMFGMGRPDVFSSGDYGIQQAMTKAYNLDSFSKKQLLKDMVAIAEKWHPYRTYACLRLWKSLEKG